MNPPVKTAAIPLIIASPRWSMAKLTALPTIKRNTAVASGIAESANADPAISAVMTAHSANNCGGEA